MPRVYGVSKCLYNLYFSYQVHLYLLHSGSEACTKFHDGIQCIVLCGRRRMRAVQHTLEYIKDIILSKLETTLTNINMKFPRVNCILQCNKVIKIKPANIVGLHPLCYR